MAGLAVAAQLFEDPSRQILVLDACPGLSLDPRIKTLASWVSLQGMM